MNKFISILENARKGKYGVGAFDVFDFETTDAVLKAAKEAKMPVIVMYPEVMTGYMPLKAFVDMTHSLSDFYGVESAIIMDHGFHYENVIKAVDAGFDAVMFDGSSLPYEQNMALSKKVADYAHKKGVTVEAELGHVGEADKYDISAYAYTDKDKAVEFVESTGIDALAVAIGTAHGRYKGTPKLDYELLAELRGAIKIPLVLHGGSSSGDENIQKAIEGGIQKVNIYTDMALAAADKMKPEFVGTEDGLFEMLSALAAGFYETALHYITVFKR